MLLLLRKYMPLTIKHILNSIYVNSLSGYVLSKLYGNRIVIDNINIEINNKIINNLYYARIFLQKYESVDGGWGYYDFRYQTKQHTSARVYTPRCF